MSLSTEKKTIPPSSLAETEVTLLEKESLKSADLERGIHFFNSRCVVRVANRFELRQKAYEYVHKVYSSQGLAKDEDSNLWLSIYNALPDTTTLVAEDQNGNLSGALTVVFDSPFGLPSDQQYKNEIDSLRNAGRQVSEMISFGIDKAQRGSVKILAGLFYCTYILAWYIRASTDCIINVVPSQSNFYCKNVLFRKIGNEKKCPRVYETNAVLLNLPLSLPSQLKGEKPSQLKGKKRMFPLSMIHYSVQEDLIIARKLEHMVLPMSAEEFYYFFIEKTDVWKKASAKQKDYIKMVYPTDQADNFSISGVLERAV